jgi:U3 small nucleolar RNA-associated protein 21
VSSLKAPQITSMSSSAAQSKYWEDVITSHVDDTVGRTWRVGAKRMGSHTLEVEEGAVQVCLFLARNVKETLTDY